ncbi:hypothetical protein PSTG_14433 [Puccinia striiformis f. sp. tritici PST-78]|uniref:Uncharacterized protein n=1 Tax=Puccinia striiformis f. sp. tritici PST-78 TaxID=1165861 RepID=A0A0L0UYZ6_9BASI|nr:hypothetical protein PSTG_14433 [Puccinia striiformis f. sp. tritici PST-78]
MHDTLKHQLHKLMIGSATQKTVQIKNLPPVLGKLGSQISHHAIQESQCLWFRLASDKSKKVLECNDFQYKSYMGMPCSHKRRQLAANKQVLKREDFHPQWHLPEKLPETSPPEPSQLHNDEDNNNLF